jgi:hypothetical protein
MQFHQQLASDEPGHPLFTDIKNGSSSIVHTIPLKLNEAKGRYHTNSLDESLMISLSPCRYLSKMPIVCREKKARLLCNSTKRFLQETRSYYVRRKKALVSSHQIGYERQYYYYLITQSNCQLLAGTLQLHTPLLDYHRRFFSITLSRATRTSVECSVVYSQLSCYSPWTYSAKKKVYVDPYCAGPPLLISSIGIVCTYYYYSWYLESSWILCPA